MLGSRSVLVHDQLELTLRDRLVEPTHYSRLGLYVREGGVYQLLEIKGGARSLFHVSTSVGGSKPIISWARDERLITAKPFFWRVLDSGRDDEFR